MSVILVNPPSLFDVNKYQVAPRYSYFEWFFHMAQDPDNYKSLPGEHLGLLSIKSYCEQQGLPVHVVNAQTLNHRTVEETWAAIQAVARSHGEPVLVGFSGPSLVFTENLQLARWCKSRWPNVAVLFGHDFPTLNYERLLQSYDVIDFVCRTEGEETFALLGERLLNGKSLEGIPNLAWRDARGRVATSPIGQPLDLDSLPWAKRDDLPAVLSMRMAAAMWGTRGCPYRCTFCTTGQTAALLGAKNSYREKSIENMVEEIAYLKRDFDINYLTITDDLFLTKHPASQERARQFALELIRRDIKLEFMFDCRVDSIDKELFELLYKAGLRRVFVGVESGSSNQLDFYKKRYTASTQDASSRLRILRDIGLEIVPGILTYHPTVTPEELWGTLTMIDACGYKGMYQFSCEVYAFPGTPLYREYMANSYLDDSTWPTPTWDFKDPLARKFFDKTIGAIATEKMTFEEIRATFIKHLEEWEQERAALQQPSSVAPAATQLTPPH